jgi:hypothetical protein
MKQQNWMNCKATRDTETMKEYTINGVTVTARNYRTAVRRVRGYLRGEFDIKGRTIPRAERKKSN